MPSETVLVTSYNYWLVALSVIIATLAAYAALDLGGRVTAARGKLRAIWLAGGAVAMGSGIWSMHYVGMLAYNLPVEVAYDWPTVLVSLVAAIVAAAIALFIVSREEMGILAVAIGGLLMGIGIASMHYIGMEAMRLPAMCHYSPRIVFLSVVLAIVISYVALFLTFHLRAESKSFGWRKVASTILMGAAIPVMHYTGMAAVTYVPMSGSGDLTHSVKITALGIGGIVSVSLIVLMLAILTSMVDRRFSEQSSHLLAEISRLNGQLKQENTRMSAELEVTHRLQHMMLPRDEELSSIPQLDISGSMDTAAEVGGDYYDVVSGEDGVVFGIGDVTGHGLESGVIAIMLQTAIRTLIACGHFESRKVFDVLNRVVYDNARRMNCDRNLTLSLLRYRNRMVTISGQHEEVLIVRANGNLERIDTLDLGFPLGLETKISPFVRETEVPLQSGDVMVVYTDGVTEAINRSGIAYGVERLCEVLKSSHKQLATKIRQNILSSVREHIGEQQLLDDLSLLVVKHA